MSTVEVDDEGRRFETYRVIPDGSEGPATLAWRLQDPIGDEVTRGILTRSPDTSAAADVVGLDKGFAWVAYNQEPDTVIFVDEAGEIMNATAGGGRVPQAGFRRPGTGCWPAGPRTRSACGAGRPSTPTRWISTTVSLRESPTVPPDFRRSRAGRLGTPTGWLVLGGRPDEGTYVLEPGGTYWVALEPSEYTD